MRTSIFIFLFLMTGQLISQIPEIKILNDRIGVNIESPTKQFHIEGYPFVNTNVFYSKVNYVGGSDVRAVEGHSITNVGFGIGGYFTGGYRGLSALGSGGTYNGAFPVYGVYATATGTTGTRIGIHAQATGGTTNLAAEFGPGDVQIDEDLSIDGDISVDGKLRVGSLADPYGGIYKVIIDGKMIAEEVRIQNSIAWPDYVFDSSYELLSIRELEKSIRLNSHLPGIPSAKEIKQDGIAIGEMQIKMMEKIEELTLYIIQLQKEIDELKSGVTFKK